MFKAKEAPKPEKAAEPAPQPVEDKKPEPVQKYGNRNSNRE